MACAPVAVGRTAMPTLIGIKDVGAGVDAEWGPHDWAEQRAGRIAMSASVVVYR